MASVTVFRSRGRVMKQVKSIVLGFAPAWVPILSIVLCGFLFKILGI